MALLPGRKLTSRERRASLLALPVVVIIAGPVFWVVVQIGGVSPWIAAPLGGLAAGLAGNAVFRHQIRKTGR